MRSDDDEAVIIANQIQLYGGHMGLYQCNCFRVIITLDFAQKKK